MSEESSGCGCCPECTGGPDCTCGCPDCMCGDCSCYADCVDCECGESKFVLSAVSSIVGMIFLGSLAILYSIFYMNDAWDLGLILGDDLSFILVAVALILSAAGVLSLRAGDLTEGLLFGLVGFTVLLEQLSSFWGFDSLFYMHWIVAIVLLVVILILFIGGDTTFGIATLLFVVGLAFFLIFDTALVPTVCGITFLISGILFLYIAISDWLFVETGIDLPIL